MAGDLWFSKQTKKRTRNPQNIYPAHQVSVYQVCVPTLVLSLSAVNTAGMTWDVAEVRTLLHKFPGSSLPKSSVVVVVAVLLVIDG